MKIKSVFIILLFSLTVSCTSQNNNLLPSWNDTPVKQQLQNYLAIEIDKIPIEDRIAVFDMDGTLICERPWGIETVVSLHRLIDLGKKDTLIQKSIEYQYAEKLLVNPRDTSVLNHCYVNGENILGNIILKPFDGVDSEEYVEYARKCLESVENKDYKMKYADMFYQPMLELVKILQEKHFQIYVVSGSMQGIVWSICPQNIGVDRDHLLGIRHTKEVSFTQGGDITYTLKASVMSPVNNYKGKVINIYNHIGKIPVVAVGNTYTDFGMFHMVSCSRYPHLALMLNHDDAKREYAYSPCHGRNINWQDTLRDNHWLQADMSKEFKTVWKK